MNQLLVFAYKKYSKRLKYVLEFLTADIADIDWVISDSDAILPEAVLIYSSIHEQSNGLNTQPSVFLEEGFWGDKTEPKIQPPNTSVWQRKEDCYLSEFDVFGSLFFFLSRMEEYQTETVTGFDNRYSAKDSFLYRSGYIDFPVVDFWRKDFLEVLKMVQPHIRIPDPKFNWELTCDVDVLFAFKGKSWIKNTAGLFRDLLTLQLNAFKLRWEWMLFAKKDPFDQLNILIDLVEEKSNPLLCFLLCPSSDKFKEDFSGNQLMKYSLDFFKSYGKKIKIGLHPSISSNCNLNSLIWEKSKLEELSGQEIRHSRQHYLSLDIPTTYRNLLAVGITDDHSMAFHDHIGFRAGTTSSFYWYDLMEEKKTGLKVHPFCLMDINFKKYIEVDVAAAKGIAQKMINNIRSVNGKFSYLWHNSSLSDLDGWSEWKSFPLDLKELAKTGKL